MSAEMAASAESRGRAEMSAEGSRQGKDRLWRKTIEKAEWMPRCEVLHVTHMVVRDGESKVVIFDSAQASSSSDGTLRRAFRKPKDVDVCVEVNLAEAPQYSTDIVGGCRAVPEGGQ